VVEDVGAVFLLEIAFDEHDKVGGFDFGFQRGNFEGFTFGLGGLWGS